MHPKIIITCNAAGTTVLKFLENSCNTIYITLSIHQYFYNKYCEYLICKKMLNEVI